MPPVCLLVWGFVSFVLLSFVFVKKLTKLYLDQLGRCSPVHTLSHTRLPRAPTRRLPNPRRPIQSARGVMVATCHRVFRSALVLGLVLTLWTFARPALAARAPFCDDRGATAMAPPPALEAPDIGVIRARVSVCEAGERSFFAIVTPARSNVSPPLGEADQALPSRSLHVVPAEDSLADLPMPGARPDAGVRHRVERPPRG